MNKPLKDWTLGEVKAYCDGRDSCIGCDFSVAIKNCMLVRAATPAEWVLDRLRWTPEEIEDAKALRRLMPDSTKVWIVRTVDGGLRASTEDGGVRDYFLLDPNLFPSLGASASVELDEIVGAPTT